MITSRDLQTDPLYRSGRTGPLRRDATLTGSLFSALVEPALPLHIQVDANGSPPSWIGPVFERLGVIANLSEDWDSYGAPAISLVCLQRTVAVMNDVMMEFDRLEPLLSPSVRGRVDIELQRPPEALVLSVGDDDVWASYDNPVSGESWEGPLSDHRDFVRQLLKRMSG